MRTLAVALLVVLAGCGGGSDPAPQATKTTATATQPTQSPTVAPPEGTPAPEALSRFRCTKTPRGIWNASGSLANLGKAKVTYQVTVYIGEAAGGEEKAKTLQVPNIAAGGSVNFTLKNVPAPKEGGPCHVQVLAKD